MLLGAPGSGKGTQAEMITRQFGIPVTSPGAILRRERDLGTDLGKETAGITHHGGLVPDDIIVRLIEDWLRLHGSHGFVFDGFPRTIPQAESLQQILVRHRTPLDLAIWLDVSEQTVAERIASRLQCQGCGFTTSVSSATFAERPVCPYCDGHLIRRDDDDDTEVLKNRLAEFNAKTQPLAAFYAEGRPASEDRWESRSRSGLRRHLAVDRAIGMIPIKSPKEIDRMRQACRTASEILERVVDLVRPGISTKEVDQAAADLMEEAGVQSAFLGYRLGHRVFPGTFAFR